MGEKIEKDIKNMNKRAINTYLSNRIYKQNEQAEQRLINPENILAVARWEGVGGWKVEGIKKSKLVVME